MSRKIPQHLIKSHEIKMKSHTIPIKIHQRPMTSQDMPKKKSQDNPIEIPIEISKKKKKKHEIPVTSHKMSLQFLNKNPLKSPHSFDSSLQDSWR